MSRGWKWVAVAVLVLGGLLGLLFWGVEAAASRRWAAMSAKVAVLEAEIRSWPSAREPLWGAGEPGSAWEDYHAAGTLASAFPRDLHEALQLWLNRSGKEDSAKVKAALLQATGPLELLTRGVRRSELPLHFNSPLRHGVVPACSRTYDLDLLLSGSLRAALESGDREGACERLRTLSQFFIDIAETGSSFCARNGLDGLRRGAAEVEEWLKSGQAEPTDLRTLSADLQKLESRIPGILARGLSLLQIELGSLATPKDYYQFPVQPLVWRYAFSWRLMVADAYQAIEEEIQSGSGVYLDPPESTGCVVNIHSHQLLKDNHRGGARGMRRSAAELSARLRMLQVAANWQAEGNLLDLEDPFGGRLRVQSSSKGLKVWSVGWDQLDNGGTGSLSLRDRLWEIGKGLDLVLEVPVLKAR